MKFCYASELFLRYSFRRGDTACIGEYLSRLWVPIKTWNDLVIWNNYVNVSDVKDRTKSIITMLQGHRYHFGLGWGILHFSAIVCVQV